MRKLSQNKYAIEKRFIRHCRKADNICVQCGGKKGKRYICCGSCREDHKEFLKRLRLIRIENKVCEKCRKKLSDINSNTTCLECKKKSREATQRRTEKRYVSGICIKCGKSKRLKGKASCSKCLELYKKRNKRARKNG